MYLAILTLISGIIISIIAAGYSIIGLATLFAGAAIPIIAMGSALEVGKLVVASWLYRNWNSSLLPRTIRYYLTTAVFVLIFITSLGIFGFLSKAHLDQVRPTGNNTIQIASYDKQIEQQQKIIDRSQKTLDQLDRALEVYIEKEFVTRGLKERSKQEEERKILQTNIDSATQKILELNTARSKIELEQIKIEADVGPLKYVAELIYGDEAKDHFDEAVRLIILILIFVFDPLAVLMLIAANISIKEYQMSKEKTQTKKKENLDKRIQTLMKKNDKYRKKQSILLKAIFGNNANVKDLEKLDPDEIKIKTSQIMDMNEKN